MRWPAVLLAIYECYMTVSFRSIQARIDFASEQHRLLFTTQHYLVTECHILIEPCEFLLIGTTTCVLQWKWPNIPHTMTVGLYANHSNNKHTSLCRLSIALWFFYNRYLVNIDAYPFSSVIHVCRAYVMCFFVASSCVSIVALQWFSQRTSYNDNFKIGRMLIHIWQTATYRLCITTTPVHASNGVVDLSTTPLLDGNDWTCSQSWKTARPTLCNILLLFYRTQNDCQFKQSRIYKILVSRRRWQEWQRTSWIDNVPNWTGLTGTSLMNAARYRSWPTVAMRNGGQ